MVNSLAMDTLRGVLSAVRPKPAKEHFAMILEPLQTMTQLAFLGFLPVGTKLSVSSNILVLQAPGWNQGVVRNYNLDGRDDIVYLFSAIARFRMHYKEWNQELYDELCGRAALGIDRLIQTYSASMADVHLLQQLRLYKALIKDSVSEKADVCDEGNIAMFTALRDLYTANHVSAIRAILSIAEAAPERAGVVLEGLNLVLEPLHGDIRRTVSHSVVG